MFIDKDSITINGISMGKYLTEVEYQYNKLWGDDTGRNLAGSFSGTLLGIFPKIVCSFRKLTPSEVEYLAPIFDSKHQTIRYYDPNKKKYETKTTYTGDWSIKYDGINHKTSTFNISFICTTRR